MSGENPEFGDPPAPLFSVIIPLEWHRDRWEQCLRAWQAQTLANSQYELVLVLSRSFTERDQLSALLVETDGRYRVVVSDSNHDMGLCVFGAEQARGQFFFFTESHCWPEQDVLALCVQAFEEQPDWAGLSCRSLPVSSNRLGAAEGAMHDAEISYGMTVHPWRKILDQCFVTRRNAYLQCGGFKPEFGHFAEWVLAANYHANGLFLGYLPQACFHHQYLGGLGELRRFSLDFVRGEIRYLADTSDEPRSHLIELPDEWIDRGNLDRALAQTLLKAGLREARLSTARRWLAPAIFGDRLQRTKASLDVAASYVGVTLARVFRSGRKLSRAYKTYQAALQHHQRLSSIAKVRRTGHQPDHAGLYHLETAGGKEFRWSEPAVAVRIDLPAGRCSVVLDCAQIFLIPNIADLRFRLDGRTIPDADVQLEPFRIVISVHEANARRATLSWTCSRFDAPSDWRALGLPLANIEVVAATH